MSASGDNSARWARLGPPILHETIEGETVIINLETGSYYSLEGPGARVWDLLDAGVSVSDLADGLGGEVALGPDALAQVIEHLLADLHAEGLVSRDPVENDFSARLGGSPEGPTIADGFALARYTDLQELLLIDPIHEVDETGWPTPRPQL